MKVERPGAPLWIQQLGRVVVQQSLDLVSGEV
ncbi:MAG: hypothetical protein QOD29_1862, partial [Alphaproteobacteria bacterium]|nr:hypothetical protein [Alphaproteobacteria bacterium]